MAGAVEQRRLLGTERFSSIQHTPDDFELLSDDETLAAERKVPEGRKTLEMVAPTFNDEERQKAIAAIWKKIVPELAYPLEISAPADMLNAFEKYRRAFVNVTALDLSQTGVSCLPAEIFSLPLTFLNVSELRLGHLPDELANLKQLKTLIAVNILLRRVPSCLLGLPKLATLNLELNLFSTEYQKDDARALAEISTLSTVRLDESLHRTYLMEVALSEALREIWSEHMKDIAGQPVLQAAVETRASLQDIFAIENPRPSQIRAFFTTCYNLKVYCFDHITLLNLKTFQVNRIPFELRCMRKVQIIDLSDNLVINPISDVMTFFPDLTTLDLRNNPIPFNTYERIREKLAKSNPKLKDLHLPELPAQKPPTQHESRTCIVM